MHNSTVRIDNVPKQCVRLYTNNLNCEETEVGPDSRQVPKSEISVYSKCGSYCIFKANGYFLRTYTNAI